MRFLRSVFSLAALASVAPAVHAAPSVVLDPVQVTATRLPEAVNLVPAAITVVSGEQIRARNAQDLRSALALVGGVEISTGGDGGGNGSVPAFYGFREFDAFLLVVDGVPAGGAFNPTLSTLDLHNVKQIEVLRGAAPVMYGATSFVGVIHVIHYPAGESEQRAQVTFGSTQSRGDSLTANGSVATVLSTGAFRQSVLVDGAHSKLSDDRAEGDRGHIAYRMATALAGGEGHFDAEYTDQRQIPQGTVRRENIGGVQKLTVKTPVDANHNPSDAEIDEQRLQFSGGFERMTPWGAWGSTAAYTHLDANHIRGWLYNQNGNNPLQANAKGFLQGRSVDDFYLDTHLSRSLTSEVKIVTGIDYLHGNARVDSTSFNYYAALDGSSAQRAQTVAKTAAANPTAANSIGRTARVGQEDERNFWGVYLQGEWQALPSVAVTGGVRYNYVDEEQKASDFDLSATSEDSLSESAVTGTFGITWQAIKAPAGSLTAYTDYRRSYKPFAFTFTPKSRQQIERSNGARALTPAEYTFSAEIYEPETADAVELGLRGELFGGRVSYDVAGHYEEFESITYKLGANGGFFTGSRQGGGKIRFAGGEAEFKVQLVKDTVLAGNYAWQDAHFGPYNTDDGTPVTGNRFEMSPYGTAGLGLLYTPATGFNATVLGNYVGGRFLNKKNTGPIPSYTTIDAHLGYSFPRGYAISVDGSNLTDEQDAISESEYSESIAGAASYYRLPGRSLWLTLSKAL